MKVDEQRFDGNRIVFIKRILRSPHGKETYESVPYWMAEAIVAEVIHEQNTESLWVVELENLPCQLALLPA